MDTVIMSAMSYWDSIRDMVRECRDKTGYPLTEIARRSGVGYKALQAFVSGQNASMREENVDSLVELAKKVGVDPPTVAKQDTLDPLHAEVHSRVVPIVDFRLFPENGRGKELVAKAEKIKLFSRPTFVDDELAVGVRMNEPIGDIRVGDVLIISPKTKPANGRAVAVRFGGALHIGQQEQRSGKVGVRLSGDSDDFWDETQYEVLGSVVDHWRSMLDKSLF